MPTDTQVQNAVNDWLDDHPEASTTVEDGSISYAKLDTNLKGKADEVTSLSSAIDEKADKEETPKNVDTDAENVDLDVTDVQGNVIARFSDGHIQTKEFDSRDMIDISDRMETVESDTADLKNQTGLTPETALTDADDSDLDITDENGNVLARFKDGHIQTKEFDSRNTSDMLKEDGTFDDLNITDEFGNVILRLRNGHIITEKFDSENASSEILEKVQADIDGINDEVEAIEHKLSGVLYRNEEAIDGIYTACRYGFTRDNQYAGNMFCLLVAGDIHGDSVRMNSIVEFLNALRCFDAGIMVGDISGTMWYDNTDFYTQAIASANKPFLTVLGNHDAQWNGSSGAEPTQTLIYEKMIVPNIPYASLAEGEHPDGKSYYYKDFVRKKIRIIILNQYDYFNGQLDNEESPYTYGYNCYSQDQIDWLVNTLANTPTDYAVICAVHSYACTVDLKTDDIFTSNHIKTTRSPGTYVDGQIIEDIIEAWVSGTTLERTYNYTQASWGSLTVSADFVNRGGGEFVAFIGGHWHNSILAESHQYKYKVFHVSSADLNSGASTGDQSRISGTRSEDSFVALAVNRKLKTFNLFAVGAHFCDDGRDRLYKSYSYETQNGGNE